MIKLKILTLLCSILFTCNLIASEHKEYHEKFEEYKNNYYNSSKHHLYKNLDYLNLDKSQLSLLKEAMKSYKKEYKRFYKFKLKKEEELSSLIKQTNFDETTYKNILDEINSKSMDLEVKNLKRIHTILDEKQREKFSYFLKEWRVE